MLRSNLRSLGNENGLFEKKAGGYLAIVALINTEKNPELKGRDLAFGGLVLGAFGFFSVTSYPIFAIAALVMVLGALTPPVKKILTR